MLLYNLNTRFFADFALQEDPACTKSNRFWQVEAERGSGANAHGESFVEKVEPAIIQEVQFFEGFGF